MDFHHQPEKVPLLRRVRLTASFGPRPQIVVAPIRHHNPAQPLDREPTPQSVNEREPLARRSLMQYLVLDPQPLEFAAKPPHPGAQFSVDSDKLTVINSTGHDQDPAAPARP